jgi:uncharacterized protein YkuJ
MAFEKDNVMTSATVISILFCEQNHGFILHKYKSVTKYNLDNSNLEKIYEVFKKSNKI